MHNFVLSDRSDGVVVSDSKGILLMPPVGDFKYDVFVSFALEDNHPDSSGGRRLVSGMVDTLRAQTAATGHVCKFFFQDSPIQDRDRWEAIVRPAVAQSRVVLAVTSEQYFQSLTCQWEWEVFRSTMRDRHTQLLHPESGPIQPVIFAPVVNVPASARSWHTECAQYAQLRLPDPAATDQLDVDTNSADGHAEDQDTDTFRQAIGELSAALDRRIVTASRAAATYADASGDDEAALLEAKHAATVAERFLQSHPDEPQVQLALASSYLTISELSAESSTIDATSAAQKALRAIDSVGLPATEWPDPNLQSVAFGHLADLTAQSDPAKSLLLRQRAVSSGELLWQCKPDCPVTTELLATHSEALAAAQREEDPEHAYKSLVKVCHLRRQLSQKQPQDINNLRQLIDLAGRTAELAGQLNESPTTAPSLASVHDPTGVKNSRAVSITHAVVQKFLDAGSILPHDSTAAGDLLESAATEAGAFLDLVPDEAGSDTPGASAAGSVVSGPNSSEPNSSGPNPPGVTADEPVTQPQGQTLPDDDREGDEKVTFAEVSALHLDSCLWAANLAVQLDEEDARRGYVAITSGAYLLHEENVDGLHNIADFLETAGRAANHVLPREASDVLLLAAMCWDTDADHFGSEESMLAKATAVFQAAELRLIHDLDAAISTALATIRSAIDLVTCFPNRANVHAADQVIGSIAGTLAASTWTAADILDVSNYRDELVAEDQKLFDRHQKHDVDTVLVTAIRLSAALASADSVDVPVDSHHELTTARVLADCLFERAKESSQSDRVRQAKSIQRDLAGLRDRISAKNHISTAPTQSSHSWLARGLAGTSATSN